MLQTVQAKPDAAAPVKPAAMENPAGGPNTFYSKFMAAMPQGDANALKAENAQAAGKEPRQSPVPDRGAQDRLRTEPAVPRGERIRPDRPADGSAARVPSAPPGGQASRGLQAGSLRRPEPFGVHSTRHSGRNPGRRCGGLGFGRRP